MKVLGPEEFASRLDFVRPLNPPEAEPRITFWPIPFEFGDNRKGTRISISKAREIAAELRASVAEAESALLREALETEQRRSKTLEESCSKVDSDRVRAMQEAAAWKEKWRRAKKPLSAKKPA